MSSSNTTTTTQRAYYHGSSLELPTLPAAAAAAATAGKAPRSRLRSLSNASKKLIAKLQKGGLRKSEEQAPPVPRLPRQQKTTRHTPPPPYHLHQQHQQHSRNTSSSSSSSSSRTPLRERCNFQLTVAVDTKPPTEKDKMEFVLDLNDQLRKLADLRSAGPRFSLLSPIRVAFPLPPTTTRDGGGSLSHLHEVLPYLSVAYCPSRGRIPYKRFTHVIKIVYLGDEDLVDPAGPTWVPGYAHHAIDEASNCQVLTLAVPRPASDEAVVVERGRTRSVARPTAQQEGLKSKSTRLNPGQLIYARDFLSLALPYYAEAHPEAVFRQRGSSMEEEPETRCADRVRVLICAPRELPLDDDHRNDHDEEEERRVVIKDEQVGATDVVSLATCYLAYATGMAVEEMLKHFDDDTAVPWVWKGAVSDGPEKKGVRYVSKVSKGESTMYPCWN